MLNDVRTADSPTDQAEQQHIAAQRPTRERSVYERVRADACAALTYHYEGSLNALFCVISNTRPQEAERAAIEAVAARGGFAACDIVWITITEPLETSTSREACSKDSALSEEKPVSSDASSLDSSDLLRLVESIDPLCLVVLDQKAAETVSRAYNQPVKLESCDSLLCRPYCAFAHFTRMLATDERKQRAWALLKELLARTNEL